MGKFRSQSVERQVEIEFGDKPITGTNDAGDISLLGGLIILCLLEKETQFIARAARYIKDKRRQSAVKHTLFRLLFEKVALQIFGYSAGLDFNRFCFDPVMQLALGWNIGSEDGCATQSTYARLEEKITKRDLMRMLLGFINEWVNSLDKHTRSVTIDPDGSAFRVHGIQQYLSFNGHYEFNAYFPLLVFDHRGWCIAPILRPGTATDGQTDIAMFNHIVKRLRRRFPKVKILLRADAGFNSNELFTWCEDNNIDYVIAGAANNNLHSGSQDQDRKAAKNFCKKWGTPLFAGPDGAKEKFECDKSLHLFDRHLRRKLSSSFRSRIARTFSDFMHRAGNGINHTKRKKGWNKDRRAIGLARFTDRGLKRRYLFTNLKGFTAQHIYDEIYSERGKAELCIREFKSLDGDRMSASEFVSNQFRMLCAGLAYNMLKLLKQWLPPRFRSLTATSIRKVFLLIPVQVKESTRRIWLNWTSSFPYLNSFFNLIDRFRIRERPA